MHAPERVPLTVGQVLPPSEAKASEQAPPPRRDLAARALWVALAGLAVIALTDLVLLWLPVRFGNPEWEFGTFTQTVDSLPLLTMMTVGLVVLGLAQAQQGALRALTVWCVLVVVALGTIAVLYLLSVSLLWQQASAPQLALVLRKAVVKMGILVTLYVLLYGYLGSLCWKGTRQLEA